MILQRSYPVIKKLKDNGFHLKSLSAARRLNTYCQFSKAEIVIIAKERGVNYTGTKSDIIIQLLRKEGLVCLKQ